MANSKTGSGLTSPIYDDSCASSVRISSPLGSEELLGTGTLLIRKRDQTVWLLTCAHVFFREEGKKLYNTVSIEYVGSSEKRDKDFSKMPDRRRWIPLVDESTDELTNRLEAGELRYTTETASDFVCIRLDWEDWMKDLPDTVFGKAVMGSSKELRGFGFPKKTNNEYQKQKSLISCIHLFECTVDTVEQGEIGISYKGHPAEDRDRQMEGFSGTGMFNIAGELVGIVSRPRGEGEYFLAKLVPALLIKERWERSEKRFSWEEISLMWMIRNPAPGQPLLPYLHQRANLFCLLNGIRGAAAIFLLNHKGEKLDAVLRELSSVVPGRAWTSFLVTQGGEFEPKELNGKGVVVFLRFCQRDWGLTWDFLKKRWREENCLLLFSVDVSPSSEQEADDELAYETPGKDNLRLIGERIPIGMRDKPYYLLLTGCFVDQNYPFPPERQEELLRRAEGESDPPGFLVRELEKRPSAFYGVVSACARSGQTALRRAGCRLAIGYWSICGQSTMHLFRGESGFLRDLYGAYLNGAERTALLGQLALSEGGAADAMLNTVLEEEDDAPEYLYAVDQCGAASRWAEKELEPCLLACLTSHAAFDLLLACLNEHKRQEEDYETLLALLERLREEGVVTDRSYYWKTLLRSRWGTAQLPGRLEGSGIPAQLFDPWPDTKDTARADYAATVRKKILPAESWLSGGAVTKGDYGYDLF